MPRATVSIEEPLGASLLSTASHAYHQCQTLLPPRKRSNCSITTMFVTSGVNQECYSGRYIQWQALVSLPPAHFTLPKCEKQLDSTLLNYSATRGCVQVPLLTKRERNLLHWVGLLLLRLGCHLILVCLVWAFPWS